ncbi:Lipopolysaccharide core heptosyltransferase RfaQ [Sporomusa ovata DSM 2662]|uniref:ADP-heptose--lipooligosaccharide heptosyltransferase II n=1 Tax=Sporomusa ovata TaxID=2378 RepID=A0A0U1KY97_9FIRM|nr:glycosyltransferase family 9 protein [Sporomusa ovata]EQB28962.1 glycosyl transferase family 9 [Sporomusa ovata DSM 2662]CQR72392.1 ADP-heptose--lipooligosaccharide heptosyltransferase II [Sporomusa ovata]
MTKEILIIRLSSIGDVIHCTPVAGALKAAWPDCKITWLVGEVCADLIKYNPNIDHLMIWSRERFEKHLRAYEFTQALGLWRHLQAELAAKTYDVVLDIQGLFLTGMIARQARTSLRIGLQDARELNPLLMTKTAKPLGNHIVERYLGVLSPLGITPVTRKMILVVPAKAKQFAQSYLSREKVSAQDKLAIVVPGTTWPTKNWPPELFATTAGMLARDFKIMLCGGRSEVARGREIASKAGVPVINAIGATSLLEMAALLEQAAVVIAGDTGPLYMAAALETPTVTIFGPTNPATYTPPGNQNAFVVNECRCSFCHKTKCRIGTSECINSVQPKDVVAQVYQVLRKL